ncbi:MAG: aminotransferase class I/II-fold pyridoxal phosphate-dependent enzyme [Leptospiraceae bacterium]|nr:aminotransferase class I/II-fold pyridoxal phosphate-dependent enzyme [Leptospiraceae bacterium]
MKNFFFMFNTELIHFSAIQDPYHSLIPPIYPSSVYTFNSIEELIEFVKAKEKPRFEYGRYGNPTNRNLELTIAHLEKTEDALLVSSGMSACTIPLLTFLQSGDHIVFTSDIYLKTRFFIEKLKKFQIEYTMVFPDYEAIKQAIRPNTKIVFTELPTNPFFYIVDIEALSHYLKPRGILLIVDATLASPYNFNPITWGADIVIHSLTKYFSGQNDLIAGVIAGPKLLLDKIRETQGEIGSILPAEISYKIQRSMKTLGIRMEYLNQVALEIAEFLSKHPKVKKVYYPFLPSHPHFQLAKKYLRGGGGLITIQLEGNLETLKTFCNSFKIFKIGPSFGSSESLIDPPYIMSHWDIPENEKQLLNITETTIRLSIGLENKEDLIKDLVQALEKVKNLQ